MTSTHLNGHHRKTLAALFAHPAGHNLEWHDVLSLLGHVGTVAERHGGGSNITVGSEHIKLGAPHGHDLTADDVRDLRTFLTKAGLTNAGMADGKVALADHDAPQPADAAPAATTGCTVLIDHTEARLFGLKGGRADLGEPRVLKPANADGSLHRIEHKQGQDDHDGGHGLEDDAYYERVAINLKLAQRIVVLSDGKGRSNAGAYLVDYLERHHPAIAQRIVAVKRVDIAHLSDGEITAMGHALLAG
jgi:hypothetical protein